MTIENETREIRQGDLVKIPPNAVHSLKPVSPNASLPRLCRRREGRGPDRLFVGLTGPSFGAGSSSSRAMLLGEALHKELSGMERMVWARGSAFFSVPPGKHD
jgi:hypothetical protein